jgi:hypothetical protein
MSWKQPLLTRVKISPMVTTFISQSAGVKEIVHLGVFRDATSGNRVLLCRVRKVEVSETQEDVGPRAGTHYALMRDPTARMKVGDKIRTIGNQKTENEPF